MSRSNRMLAGSKRWDSYEDVPLTQCFESGSQHDVGDQLSRSSGGQSDDLKDSNGKESSINVAVIVVSSRRVGSSWIIIQYGIFVWFDYVNFCIGMGLQINVEEIKKSCLWMRDYLDMEEQESPSSSDPPNDKPVDEDLYKIPPELLFSKPKKRAGLCLFSSCLLPASASF
ncbi:hypothetical protein SAY86_025021 [Trapa natans]|uniref:Uncharacterized protein n=1 Tax=Trapa natans TaxID=22666 RepID=A0AAN7MR58_TRANT|nr:hypothetical protein SAY86_025021 [Trapa natans]